jgi:cysteine synthase
MACAAKGYPLVIVMAENFSIERRKLLRFLGAKVVLTSAAEKGTGMLAAARRLADRHGWFLCRQFESEVNADVHSATTAQEILRDFGENGLDYWVSGFGTGGTIKGVARVLRERSPSTRIIACEPDNSALLMSGVSQPVDADGQPTGSHPSFRPHLMQGWSPDFLSKLAQDVVRDQLTDEIVGVAGADALAAARELARKEGVFCGISSGATFAAALDVAKRAPAGSRILAMLPDTGERYLSTPLFADIGDAMNDEEQAIADSALTPNGTAGDKTAPAPAAEADPAAMDFIEKAIAESPGPLVMFALEWCEFCWSVRHLLKAAEIPFRSIDLDSTEFRADHDADAIRSALKIKTGAPTIPQIFVSGEHVGGCSEVLSAFASGALQSRLADLGIELPKSGDIDPYSFLPAWSSRSMKRDIVTIGQGGLYAALAAYAEAAESVDRPLDQGRALQELRKRFGGDLPDEGRPATAVIHRLIQAAEPGLVGSTRPGFLAWVIGSSSQAGVAADWLTSLWGQNAGIFQTSPAAAVSEEVCERWLLELLDLPREASIGFVTGATMATFVGLAAARTEVLRRHGYDVDRGVQNAPQVAVLIGEEAHVSNFAALRNLGFGLDNFVIVEANSQGVMKPDALRAAASGISGPAIIVAQAGHIHTGAFDDFEAAADVARSLGGWLHVDGAFGLWARCVDELATLTRGIERADSWSVDAHKWLQVPYDSGFAIVRDRRAHRRTMSKSAGYLNQEAGEGRNPADYNPELSRRARGFAVWAMLQSLGRNGITAMVSKHCEAAREFADHCARIVGVKVLNDVVLNQVALDLGPATQSICDRINETGNFFVRTAQWRGGTILRVSFCGEGNDVSTARKLASCVEVAVAENCLQGTNGGA